MKCSIVMALVVSCCFSYVSKAQDMDAEQKAWMEYITPGKVHQMYTQMAGEWTFEMSIWMAPGAKPMKSTGTSKYEMILGGRYLKGMHSGDFMGMPMEGMSIDAFDNALQEVFSTWIDNLGTGLTTYRGKFDESMKVLKLSGTMVDPISKKEKPTRSETIHESSNKYTQKMYNSGPDGKEFLSMEMVFTKK